MHALLNAFCGADGNAEQFDAEPEVIGGAANPPGLIEEMPST